MGREEVVSQEKGQGAHGAHTVRVMRRISVMHRISGKVDPSTAGVMVPGICCNILIHWLVDTGASVNLFELVNLV